MKANGLMVGNYLKNDSIVVKIDARSIFDMYNDNPKYEPIELNEYWLEKLGFYKNENTKHWSITYFNSEKMGIDKWSLFIGFDSTMGYWFGVQDLILDQVALNLIKYVHQLQNLYFSLTGKELTI